MDVNPFRTRSCVIGLTGNIACGKSTIAGILRELGAETIDADSVVHQMMGPDSLFADALQSAFDDHVVNEDRSINRRALGAIVFSDSGKLALLEEIVHPPVVATMKNAVFKPGPAVLVLDAIKLFEAGIAEVCDCVWVADASRETQIRRIMERGDVDRAEAERRIDAQPPQSEKVQKADVVIDNNGTISETRRQVERAWNALCH